jgi:hypothetical protein
MEELAVRMDLVLLAEKIGMEQSAKHTVWRRIVERIFNVVRWVHVNVKILGMAQIVILIAVHLFAETAAGMESVMEKPVNVNAMRVITDQLARLIVMKKIPVKIMELVMEKPVNVFVMGIFTVLIVHIVWPPQLVVMVTPRMESV